MADLEQQLQPNVQKIAEARRADDEKMATAKALARQVLGQYPDGAPEAVLINDLTEKGVQNYLASYAVWNLYTFEDGEGLAHKDMSTGVVAPIRTVK